MVDLTDDFEEQEQYVNNLQEASQNDNALQYFDNREQFLSTEE